MRRSVSQLSAACRDETGSVMPILMIMATLLLISGVAFLSVSAYQAKTVSGSTTHIQAKYYAEQAIRKAIWRIGQTDPDTWATWATFDDSTCSASFDTTSNTITAIGQFGGVSDTIRVQVALHPVPAEQITHILAYEVSYTVHGTSGALTYPNGYGPHQIEQVPILDTNYYRDNANYRYTGDQTFSAPLAAGIHFIDGNATVKNGMTLTGALIATGTIKLQGQVTITAAQVPSNSPYYPAYYPAVASLDTTEITADDVYGGNQNLQINGILYARGHIDLNPAHINGVIIGKIVDLRGAFSVEYNSAYALPPPGMVLWPSTYNPSISQWDE